MNAEAWLVIGLGNVERGDDAVGQVVAGMLAGTPGIRIVRRCFDPLALIMDWVKAGQVIIVDSACGAGEPGRIHRLEFRGAVQLQEANSPAQIAWEPPPASTHSFGVVQALALARTLGELPARLIVYAIEGATFECGASMSPVVEAAARLAAERIREEAVGSL